MKTTIEISDALLSEAKKVSAQQHLTLRALVEQGLREVIQKHQSEPAFKLRPASFKGKGLQPAYRGASWSEVRSAIYKGRGE